MEIRIIDAFAGIGGIRLGVEQAAAERGHTVRCVASIEWDGDLARRTYVANFGEEASSKHYTDITKIEDFGELPEHDILLAGFPCQVFSRNGRHYNFNHRRLKGLSEDDRSNLVTYLYAALKAKQPAAFLFENVREITVIRNADGTSFFENLMEDLRGVGYLPDVAILDAKDFGLAQQRVRAYIAGFRKNLAIRPQFPSPPRLHACVRDILEPLVNAKYLIESLWRNRMSGVGHQRQSRLPDSTRLQALRNAYEGRGFDGVSARNTRIGLRTWTAAQGIKAPTGKITPVAIIYGDTPSGLPRQQDKLYSAWGVSPTIATFSTPCFDTPQGWRVLTPRECARLQGLPEDFGLPAKDAVRYRQIGNSVAVPVVKTVAQRLLESLETTL